MAHEYQPIRQLIEFNCHNCHTKVVVDPTNQEEVEAVGEWIKVEKSDGTKLAFDTVECLLKGAHFLRPKSGIVV